MQKTFLIPLTVFLTIVGAYILGNYYHQIGFEYPIWYSEFLMDTFKPSNAEEAYDLYIISNFVLSFFAACFISGLTFLLWKGKSTPSGEC